ncbi:hypothetical protein Q3W71_14135 [Micromonospora sp. C28SCA-DRY-2]|uniref:hypothetical protein n=1 Tax=Micromonospora sp. C28SCA-DRY-2 TaxID=3059522 RepID=UPI0026764BB9|nr:hypothetical protein [Micromonospora sp. C28SCA-DRY-2]MDO3702807.1 hypothetical protein [Micromonospora sp. C28SCA-DRY-2]
MPDALDVRGQRRDGRRPGQLARPDRLLDPLAQRVGVGLLEPGDRLAYVDGVRPPSTQR